MTVGPNSPLAGPATAVSGAWGVSFAFDATHMEVRRALEHVDAWLKTGRVPNPTVDRVSIALAEALNNIVEHAFAERDHGRITLSVVATEAGVEMEICDNGRAMPEGDAPPCRQRDLSVPRADLPEGGFGWGLIRETAAGISYRRVAGHNLLTLRVLAAHSRRAE